MQPSHWDTVQAIYADRERRALMLGGTDTLRRVAKVALGHPDPAVRERADMNVRSIMRAYLLFLDN